MREILFRGKAAVGTWIESDSILQFEDHPIKKCRVATLFQADEGWVEVIPETVGQYTGLTDKNGKKIFEGDIILFEDESPTNYEYHDSTEMRCGEIEFDGGEFYLTNRIAVEKTDLVYDNKLDGQIVGNIHDNPELLK